MNLNINNISVSVLIPNYNDAESIENVLFSIINQTLKPLEILVIDDCSEDNSIAIIEKCSKEFKFPIKIIKNSKNIGVIKTVNNNLKYLKGDFFFLGSANDKLFNNFFYDALNTFAIDDRIKVVFGNVVGLDKKNRKINFKPRSLNKSEILSPLKYRKFILEDNPLGFSLTPSALYHKSIFRSLMFDNYLKSYADTYFTNNICLNHYSIFVNKSFSYWQIDQKSYSQKKKIITNIQIYIRFIIKVFKEKKLPIYGFKYISRWIIFYPLKFFKYYVSQYFGSN